MKQPTWRYGLAALLVAWVVDIFFWKTPPGVSFFLWTLLAIGAGLGLSFLDRARPSRWSYLLIVLVLAFSAITFLRAESLTVFVALLLTMAGLVLLTVTFRNGNWIAYRIWDYLVAGVRLVEGVLVRPLDLLRTAPRTPPLPSDPGSKATPAPSQAAKVAGQIGRVLVGLLLALPVLAVLASLLSSADPIFRDRLQEFLKIFNLENLAETIFRMFYILVLAFIFTGVYLHAIHPARAEQRPDPSKPWLKPFVGWTESAVILLAIDLMFVVFTIIQFWYFFGGEANITAAGYTYADYARRGFFELVAVAVISLMVYLGLSTFTRRDSIFAQRGFTVLSVFLMAMLLVMLVSAYQRLALYEGAYGFTHLRLYTHIYMVWLGILIAAAIVFELLKRSHHFGLALLTVVVGFGLTLGLMNIERVIVEQNIQRASTSQKFDGSYLASLSSDGVPALLEQYRRSDQAPAIRDALGAELACRTARVSKEPLLPWTGFNLSKNNARNLLLLNQTEWAAYPVKSSSRSGWVVTINGKEQPCISSYRFD